MHCRSILWFTSLLLLGGCTGSEDLKYETTRMLEQQAWIGDRHAKINAKIDSLWDHTSALLERELPADFPPVDRNVFINSRNADHIRMFMSFKDLDIHLQDAINKAAVMDQIYADSIKAIAAEMRAFEKNKNAFLARIARQDPAAARICMRKLSEADGRH